MSRFRSRALILASTLPLLTLSVGSCSYGPPAVKQPYIRASAAGSQAIELYDANGDGRVAGAELEKAPGLQAALPRIDANNDGALTADEIAARVEVWQGTKLGLMSLICTVTLDGRPLEDATLTLEPETFLGDEIQASVCSIDEFGTGAPSVPKQLRPDPQRTPSGVQLGLYQVKISKVVNGKETIPGKYNEATVLGQEVAPDVPELASLRLKFALSTK